MQLQKQVDKGDHVLEARATQTMQILWPYCYQVRFTYVQNAGVGQAIAELWRDST